MISYDPFWKMISKSDISQYRLIRYYKISASQISRLKHNLPVSTETIRQICDIFQCAVNDVMIYVPEDKQGERLF